jgi:hypothetical protein
MESVQGHRRCIPKLAYRLNFNAEVAIAGAAFMPLLDTGEESMDGRDECVSPSLFNMSLEPLNNRNHRSRAVSWKADVLEILLSTAHDVAFKEFQVFRDPLVAPF